MSRFRSILRLLGLGLLVVLLGGAAATATMDRWLFAAMHPGAFDPATTPPPPDYGTLEAWAAHPHLVDGSDVVASGLTRADAPRAAVFYIHPTTWMGPAWNGPTDDPAVATATERGGTLIQASAFNGCCAVWGPRYRQAFGGAFVTPSEDGDRAIDVAYADVARAFDAFLAGIDDAPFGIASHSQGSVLAARLLRERVAPERTGRLFGAWVVGGPVAEEDSGVPACASPTQVGCVAAWNTRGPGYRPTRLEFHAAAPDTMTRRLCVNPVSWRTDGEPVGADRSLGALFLDAPNPGPLPGFAGGHCVDGAMHVGDLGDLRRDVPSRVLLWLMGPENHHPVEYQLHYMDIRTNARERLAAWERGRR